MKYKAIISDIDGTLAPLTWHAKVNTKVSDAIHKVQQKYIYFCLATGKPFGMIEHLLDELSLTSPVIVDNGAAIYSADTKEVLWESPMSYKEVKEILAICKTYKYRIRLTEGKMMACGLKVAMGNAVPELKAIADYIAPSVDEDGVAAVIEKFVLHP